MANIQVLAIFGVLLMLVPPASIAMPQDTPAEVKSCKAISDDKQRLRCFDGLFGGPSKAQNLSEEKQVGESPEAKQGNWSIDETKSSNGSPQVVAANLVGDILQDIPKHVLITSAAVTKGGTTRAKHFALVCNSSVPLKIGVRAFKVSNSHYKKLSKDGKLGKSASQRTTAALVRWTTSPILGAECDSLIDFSADLCTPYCVELFDPVLMSPSAMEKLNQQIAHGLHPPQWLHAVAVIRR